MLGIDVGLGLGVVLGMRLGLGWVRVGLGVG